MLARIVRLEKKMKRNIKEITGESGDCVSHRVAVICRFYVFISQPALMSDAASKEKRNENKQKTHTHVVERISNSTFTMTVTSPCGRWNRSTESIVYV